MRCVLCALALVVVSTGCERDQDAVIRVDPATSAADQPVRITADGLPPDEQVTLSLRATDTEGIAWRSSATFGSDGDGELDVARTPSTQGTYTGTSAMGLVWSMQPERVSAGGGYFWRPGTGSVRLTLTASVGGEQVAATAFRRALLPSPVVTERLTLRDEGFVGVLVSPADPPNQARPAVVVLGGSEGGIPLGTEERVIAAHGYPVLALAYFGEPGLPARLANVPLEYIARAIRWLAQRPGVDPGRIAVWGASRGSEAALLVGAHHRELVSGVVATVPSNVALCGFPDCDEPAWTLRGRALPYTREFNTTRPSDEPAAVIPVERIRAPLFLVCGGLDPVWNSCAFSKAIVNRRRSHGGGGADRLYEYPNAGHALASLMPYLPDVAIFAAEQRARADAWERLLEYLRTL